MPTQIVVLPRRTQEIQRPLRRRTVCVHIAAFLTDEKTQTNYVLIADRDDNTGPSVTNCISELIANLPPWMEGYPDLYQPNYATTIYESYAYRMRESGGVDPDAALVRAGPHGSITWQPVRALATESHFLNLLSRPVHESGALTAPLKPAKADMTPAEYLSAVAAEITRQTGWTNQEARNVAGDEAALVDAMRDEMTPADAASEIVAAAAEA